MAQQTLNKKIFSEEYCDKEIQPQEHMYEPRPHDHEEDCCCDCCQEEEESMHECEEDCCCDGCQEEESMHEYEEHSCCGHNEDKCQHKESLKINYENNNAFKNVPKQVYIVENIDCANCAAKIERKIQQLPQVDFANLTFATKQLQLVTNIDEDILPIIQEVCSSVQSEVVVTKREKRPSRQVKKQIDIFRENKRDFLEIVIGAIFFIGGSMTKSVNGYLSLVLYLIGYIILGGKVLLTAAKNLVKGQVFDENFLMSIATLGALVIREYPEAVGVMLFYRVGELFEEIAVARSRSQIMDAVDMRPEVVNKVNDDKTVEIPAEDAMIGDLLLVRPGDRVPLDGMVMEGESRIDTSPVTGEPIPVAVKTGDSVTSGCVNTSGLLKIRVEKVLEDSMVTRILDSVENAAAGKPKIDRFITRFSRVYTPFVVILAAATAIIPSLITGNWNYWVYTALTFLVISCPCALVLSVPLAFFSGIGAGSKRGILFKGGVAIEALEGVKAIVMDKTGTITQGNFAVQEAMPEAGMTKEQLFALAGSCEMTSTHPIANSIVTAAREENIQLKQPVSVEEISGRGIKAELEEGTALCGNRNLMEAYQVDLSGYEDTTYGTEVLLALNGVYVGRLVIADAIKKEAKSAVMQLKQMGVVTAMLTGDAERSADSVARETGIDEVHAKLLPDDKVEELKKIRTSHGSVMFVGDGINDAPVLAGADVGAAMGSGADAAIEAADVVFMTSSVAAIPQSLKIARTTAVISKQNVVFALTIKILVMLLGLAGLANMWMAVFADTGVAMLCILNSVRILYKKI